MSTILLKQVEFIYQTLKSDEDYIATLLLKPFFVHVFLETNSLFKHLLAKLLIREAINASITNRSSLNDLLKIYVTNLRNAEMGSYLFLEFINEYMSSVLNEKEQICFISKLDLVRILIKIDRLFSYNCSNEWKRLLSFKNEEQNRIQMMEILAENLNLIGSINLSV